MKRCQNCHYGYLSERVYSGKDNKEFKLQICNYCGQVELYNSEERRAKFFTAENFLKNILGIIVENSPELVTDIFNKLLSKDFFTQEFNRFFHCPECHSDLILLSVEYDQGMACGDQQITRKKFCCTACNVNWRVSYTDDEPSLNYRKVE